LTHQLGWFSLPYLLFLASIFIAIFVVDFEHQVIPDSFVFLLFTVSLLALLIFPNSSFYFQIFLGFLSSFFFLLLYAVTKGKGMGLGDVKLVLAGGVILGATQTFFWITTSFIIGGVVGLILILFKKARFGKPIAFGPFLVSSFFLTVLLGEVLVKGFEEIFNI